MSTTLKITLAQICPSPDKQANLITAQQILHKASDEGSDLVIFPETFMAMVLNNTQLGEIAEPVSGPFVRALGDLAKRYSINVVCGIWETLLNAPDKPANTAIAIGSDGNLLSDYSKIHLFDALGHCESQAMTAGNAISPLFKVKDISIGLAICYDLRFPELFRELALRGAEVILLPAAWYAGPHKAEQWLTLLKSRAIENTVYTVGVNFCGERFSACSAAFDPFGLELTQLGETESTATVHIEKERLRKIRAKMPTLTHIRGDIFTGKIR